MTGQQIEAARVTISRHLKRKGKLWIRIFPHKPVTKKPAETRMGKGKGAVEHWVAVVKPGRVLFEVTGLDEAASRDVLVQASRKLPIKCQVVARHDMAAGSEGA